MVVSDANTNLSLRTEGTHVRWEGTKHLVGRPALVVEILLEPPIGAPNHPASRPEEAAEKRGGDSCEKATEERLPRQCIAAVSVKPDGRRKRVGRKQSKRIMHGGRGLESELWGKY